VQFKPNWFDKSRPEINENKLNARQLHGWEVKPAEARQIQEMRQLAAINAGISRKLSRSLARGGETA
jgi:hypothetical protein